MYVRLIFDSVEGSAFHRMLLNADQVAAASAKEESDNARYRARWTGIPHPPDLDGGTPSCNFHQSAGIVSTNPTAARYRVALHLTAGSSPTASYQAMMTYLQVTETGLHSLHLRGQCVSSGAAN